MMGLDSCTIFWGLFLCITVTIAVDIVVLWMIFYFMKYDDGSSVNNSSTNLK